VAARELVVGCDGSDGAEAALEVAITAARELGDRLAKKARAAGIEAETLLVAESPAAALDSVARERRARMIVVGTYGEGPFTSAILARPRTSCCTSRRYLFCACRPSHGRSGEASELPAATALRPGYRTHLSLSSPDGAAPIVTVRVPSLKLSKHCSQTKLGHRYSTRPSAGKYAAV
jgi:hypothetical protein